MRRFTIVFIVAGAVGLTFAATYWLVAQHRDSTTETTTEDRRRTREEFFKAPEEKALVGQEMRPRW
ncbi:entry exclusion protein TrbK [Rhizobium giardinii]|uniref:Ti type entry exclusion protein TrbK n=1 Tax=Rhizobium giardinii TaxID=56731 RepID=A0A7W8XA58_9HYPH|nr:Ti type entry exclusion protein TrbK [Rhizobium giardinii]